MNFLNLTPHSITILDAENVPVKIDRTEVSAGRFLLLRANTQKTIIGKIGDINITKTVFGAAELVTVDAKGQSPQPYLETIKADFLIVSQIALNACNGEFTGITCYSPGELLRDDKGQPIGAQGLSSL